MTGRRLENIIQTNLPASLLPAAPTYSVPPIRREGKAAQGESCTEGLRNDFGP